MAELRKNTFKAALQKMELQRGLWCAMRDPLAAEMMADLGFDWMLFDTEHTPMDPITVLPMLQAVAPYPVSPIVRASCLNVTEIKRLLDIGAQSILIPYVQTPEEASLAAAAVAYPPDGIRGVAGNMRASGFGKIPEYHKRARDEICLLVQVETVQAVQHIEEIAAIDGIDGIFVGPADLGASMGYPGQPGHPEVTKAVLDAIRRIRAAGKPPGILTLSPEVRDEAIAAGAVFVAGDMDIVALRKGLEG